MADDSRSAEQRVLQATWAQSVNASEAETFNEPSAGIHPHTSGNITIRFAQDTADRTIPVLQGVFYPYSVISCPSSNAVAFTAVFNTVP